MNLIDAAKMALVALKRGRPQIVGVLVQQDQDAAIAALQETIAEAEPVEPVAYMMVNPSNEHLGKSLHWKPQENWHITWEAMPLYTAPLHRKPLTESQIAALIVENEVMDEAWPSQRKLTNFARALEVTHGIKEESK